jgi:DNA polymerase
MNKSEELEKLREKMKADKALPLRDGTTNLVFGEGNEDAKIMFIGEGPGYWEDRKGLPFVGNAGAFLNQLLTSIKLPREDVFITNVVHFRPPGNRDPLPSELEAFKPYLDKMIEIIDPEVMVTLGRFSMAKFLPGVTISRIHGKPRKVDWKKKVLIVIPMYHPAAGLRNPDIKKALFDDFKKIPEVLEELEKVEKDSLEKDENVEQMSLV